MATRYTARWFSRSSYRKETRDHGLAKEALYNQVRGLDPQRDPVETFPAIAGNARLQELRAQLDTPRAKVEMYHIGG